MSRRAGAIALLALAAAAGTCGAADAPDWFAVDAAWRAGDHTGARDLLATFDETALGTAAGRAWRARLAVGPDDLAALAGADDAAPATILEAAWVAFATGEAEAAGALMNRLATDEGEPAPATLLLRGLSRRRLGAPEDAREALATIKPESADFAWARYLLGRIALAEGDHGLARRYFEQADGGDHTLCQAEVLGAVWETVRGADPRHARRLERELANRFPASLPLVRVRELERRRQGVESRSVVDESEEMVPHVPVEAPVAIEEDDGTIVDDDAPALPAEEAGGRYALQLGAFGDRGRALAMRDRALAIFETVDIVSSTSNGRTLYRVHAGAYGTHAAAEAHARALREDRDLDSVVVQRSGRP